MSIRSHVLLGLLAVTTGCAGVDSALYEVSNAAAPAHPVTGKPVFNLVPEAQEIEVARQLWEQTAAAARRDGMAVDPPGARMTLVSSTFRRLTAVAHRQHLPWEVHLLDDPGVNAFTPGGGMVIVLDGIFGGLVDEESVDELAAVLAHEVAHVTLLHASERRTWMGVGSLIADGAKDAYFRASFTTQQEAEADRLAALYLALAGFDPMAASRIWARAQAEAPQSASDFAFLHDHPLSAERTQATQEAAAQVAAFRIPGERNPEWASLLATNPLFPRANEGPYVEGEGLRRVVEAAAESYLTYEAAEDEQKQRERAARREQRRLQAASAIQVVATRFAPTADGKVGMFVDVYNGSPETVHAFGLVVGYYGAAQQALWADRSCGWRGEGLAPGQQVRVGCHQREVPGASQLQVAVEQVEFAR